MPPGLEARTAAPLLHAAGSHARARAAWAFIHALIMLELNERFPDDGVSDLAWQSGVAALKATKAGRAGSGDSRGLRAAISLTKVRDMAANPVAAVRRFNRVVTQRLGALN